MRERRRKKSPYWLTRKEVQEIMMCGTTKASEFLKMVNDDIKAHGKIVPMKGRTSRSWFMRFFNLEG